MVQLGTNGNSHLIAVRDVAKTYHRGSEELHVLQSPRVAYRGQIVAVAVSETLEGAQEAQRRTRREHDHEQPDSARRARSRLRSGL